MKRWGKILLALAILLAGSQFFAPPRSWATSCTGSGVSCDFTAQVCEDQYGNSCNYGEPGCTCTNECPYGAADGTASCYTRDTQSACNNPCADAGYDCWVSGSCTWNAPTPTTQPTPTTEPTVTPGPSPTPGQGACAVCSDWQNCSDGKQYHTVCCTTHEGVSGSAICQLSDRQCHQEPPCTSQCSSTADCPQPQTIPCGTGWGTCYDVCGGYPVTNVYTECQNGQCLYDCTYATSSPTSTPPPQPTATPTPPGTCPKRNARTQRYKGAKFAKRLRTLVVSASRR